MFHRLFRTAVEADFLQCGINGLQGLFSQIGDLHQPLVCALQKIENREDFILFQTIYRPNRKVDFSQTEFQPVIRLLRSCPSGNGNPCDSHVILRGLGVIETEGIIADCGVGLTGFLGNGS